MERLKTTKSIRLGKLKMYREDLNRLIELFTKNCATVTIADKQNRYESLEEMKNHVGSRIHDLDIAGDGPAVRFITNQAALAKGSNPPTDFLFHELRTEVATEDAEVVFFRIREFLQPFQRPRYHKPSLVVAILSAGLLAVLLAKNLTELNGMAAVRLTVPLVFALCLTVAAFIASGNVRDYFSLDSEPDSRSFWERNKETVEKQLISSLIGGLIGYLIGHFLK